MIRQYQHPTPPAHETPAGRVSAHTIRDASSLADLADGRRWIVAHQALEAGSRMQWWWYIGSEDAVMFQRGRDKGIFGSVQRRTAEGYELIGWQVGVGKPRRSP